MSTDILSVPLPITKKCQHDWHPVGRYGTPRCIKCDLLIWEDVDAYAAWIVHGYTQDTVEYIRRELETDYLNKDELPPLSAAILRELRPIRSK